MKFILFVEGHTEDKALPAFLKKWLDPKLKSPVRIQTVRFDGWPELFRDAAQKAKMHLNGPSKDLVCQIKCNNLGNSHEASLKKLPEASSSQGTFAVYC
jgi:hypothetical protein